MANSNSSVRVDALVVGAGFAGLYLLHRLRGQGLTVQVVEAGSDIGGTWFWNRYPGARCDIASMEYSYQFSEELQQEWEWSEKYATQPEILRYINHVAERFDLRRDIQLNSRVLSARYSETSQRWDVETDTNDRFDAQFVVMATGCLSTANLPDIAGRDDFAGATYHTGRWPHEGVDFTGQRVAVIGTGSSGIQSIPLIAEQAKSLTVFQRSPNYSVPAHNRPLEADEVAAVKARYRTYRDENRETAFHADFGYGEANALEVSEAERKQEFEARWERGGLPFLAAFADLMFDREANNLAAEFLRNKIRSLVDDPATAEKLVPQSVVGCKRLCVDTNYFATYNRDNVELVDLQSEALERITATGIDTSDRQLSFDSIVFATGFDAMTGALLRIDIQGCGGQTIQQAWEDGAKSYLGLAINGFPNLFMVTGPGSPSVLTNMLPSIEHHVDWISDCIATLRARGLNRIEATEDAQEDWVAHVNEVGDASVYPHCNSWYLGANVPGKPRVFLPYLGFPPYAEKCQEVVNNGYEGFALSA